MENTTKKVTKAQRYADIIALLNGEAVKYNTTTTEAVEFINAQIEQVNKKNSTKSTKPTEADIEKDRLRNILIDYLRENGESTCSTMVHNIDDLAPYSTQKVVGLLKEPKDAGIVGVVQRKGVTYYFTK